MENYLYYSDPFFAYNNSLYIEKTINGKPVNIKLSNFLARITEDITCTNGAENERYLSIVGTDDKGKDLRKITVPLKNFAQLDWAQEYWGINCVIESGYGNRDNLRQAIQSTAKYAEAKTIYGTTGWWETATGWQFCMPGNSNAEVELTEKTKGYSFKTDADVTETMTVMKNFAGIWIELRFLHPLNASLPIFVSESGMLIEERERQKSNARSPISSIPSNKVIDVIFLHPENAPLPIFITLGGIIIDVIVSLSLLKQKAHFSISVTHSGITTSVSVPL